MRLTVHPVLKELRAVYDVGGRHSRERFGAYLRLMLDGPERLPLGDFSPMGERQPAYLDALLQMDAERVAAVAAREIETEQGGVPADLRLVLVVTDQPGNGWTQRWLTDAAWRFGPHGAPPQGPATAAGWVTVQLWTHVPPTPGYLRSQLRAAVTRAVWRGRHGSPVTLAGHLRQEGAALRAGGGLFAAAPLTLDPEEQTYTRQVLEPLLGTGHWPTVFAALYGDGPAREVGFPPLGLSPLAGFALALAGTTGDG